MNKGRVKVGKCVQGMEENMILTCEKNNEEN